MKNKTKAIQVPLKRLKNKKMMDKINANANTNHFFPVKVKTVFPLPSNSWNSYCPHC